MTTYPITKYPQAKDTADFIEVIDGETEIDSNLFSKISGAILAIEKECGIKPSGIYSDVRQRLDAMQVNIQTLAANTFIHSTTISTYFLHNWISAPILGNIPYTSVGRLYFNPRVEAGFADGYGSYYYKGSISVDADITNFELSLWDITNPNSQIELRNDIFDAGDHNFTYVMNTIPLDDTDKVYELRVKQTTTVLNPLLINSKIWNIRFLFKPLVIAGTGGGGGGGGGAPSINCLLLEITPTIISNKSALIGTIPALSVIQTVSVVIDSEFQSDGYVEITIGDVDSNDRIMSYADNIPIIADTYNSNCNVEYKDEKDIYAYFSGSTNTGHAVAIVYFHTSDKNITELNNDSYIVIPNEPN